MQLSKKEHIFLSLCKGILRFWTLTEEKALSTVQTIVLDIEKLITVFVGPLNTTFIAISSEYWALFTAANSYCLEKIRCPYSSGWSGGVYIDCYHVIIWTLDGHACLYRIPDISKHHPMDFGNGSENVPDCPSPNLDFSVLLYTFLIDNDKEENTRTRLLGSQIICCINKEANLLCFADERGALTLFEIPRDKLQLEIEDRSHDAGQPGSGILIEQVDPESIHEIQIKTHKTVDNPKVKTVYAKMKGSIQDTFTKVQNFIKNQRNISNHAINYNTIISEQNNDPEVTVSSVFSDNFSLIRGYSNGTITIHSLPQDDSPKIFPSCHSGKITAILLIHKKQDYYLITGGDDCLIHAWDMATGEKLCTWPQHCGTILKLLPVPNESYYMSIASDYSVGLFSYNPMNFLKMFTGHKSEIISVQLRIDQDYLFVFCADQTITVWEFSTGNYEGCFTSDSLKEVTEMSMTDLPIKKIPSADLQNEIYDSITLFSSDTSPPRPCSEILLFNVRQLIEETYRRKEFNLENRLKETLRFYSFIVPWGIDKEVDRLALSLGISPPKDFESITPGLFGDNGKITLFVPHSKPAMAPFSLTPRTTAVFLLSALSFTNALLQTTNDSDVKTIFAQLLSQFGAMFAESISNFKPPCLGFLTNFWRDKIIDIQQSARSLFFGTLDRQSPTQRSGFILRWTGRMKISDRHNLKSKAIPGLLLGIVVANRTDILKDAPDDLPQQIATSLTRLVLSHPETSYQLIAAEILARGYTIWGDYVTNESKIFQHLLSVVTPAPPGKLSPTEKSIWILATKMLDIFINTVSNLSKTKNFSVAEYTTALRVTNKILIKIPFSILNDLHTVVEYIIRSLNPKVC